MSDYVDEEQYLENPTFDQLMQAMLAWESRDGFDKLEVVPFDYGDGERGVYLMARRKKTEAEIANEKEQKAQDLANKQKATAQRTAKLIADLDKKLAELQKEKAQCEAELAVYKEFP